MTGARWRTTSGPARALGQAVTDAVAAAASADAEEFARATDAMTRAGGRAADAVLEHVVRTLLEQSHLEGLTGDDVALVLDGCSQRAGAWFPDVDPGVLVVVLTGALGILDPEEDEPDPPTEVAIARHAVLVVADLLAEGGRSTADLDGPLDAALAELERTQGVELP